MAYTQLTTSAAAVQFCRALGGTGLHIGILGAIPSATLFMQFIAAHAANRVRFRRPLWFWACIAQRLCYLPVAAGPWLFPESPRLLWLWAFLGISVLEQSLLNFGTPLWLSWMGDYLPRKGLSEYWGTRHRFMQWSAGLCLLGCTLFFAQDQANILAGFAVMIATSSLLGVIDILMFRRVDEPPVTPAREVGVWKTLSAPFRQPGFRRYIGFMSYWNLAAMLGAPFISMFLLDYVGLKLYQVLFLWTTAAIGGALSSRWLGRLTEQYGNRPILVLSILLKPINMLTFLICPQDPTAAMWTLVPLFMFDAVLNVAILIANNGFLLKNSPAENRTMYIAAGTAVAGLVGGATSICAGLVLSMLLQSQVSWGPMLPTGFHILFLTSMVMRALAIPLVFFVQEPNTADAMTVAASALRSTQISLIRLWPRRRRIDAFTRGIRRQGSKQTVAPIKAP
jgi:hypothetical protein